MTLITTLLVRILLKITNCISTIFLTYILVSKENVLFQIIFILLIRGKHPKAYSIEFY